ncbi:DNA topoisomerase I, bacterial [Longilinea arvoryzae]|uniref:DNA topoisomerase 1 n=1 Tax=Longilinea arvoryzae TaxID=360412 RepID=A0A0S7BIJ7_9CHLR|nr:type I DNA topoisomerase [Longilinea arvoryzae]GAP14403.1 DNA topoisomerase I, bacterial [Longilinea arvoryzae]
MEAYCVKCKQKREIQNPQADFNKVGAPITRGTCPVCSKPIFRMGRTPAHDGLTPPEKVSREPKRKGKLVIVESPAKARTVGRFLGKGFTVRASVGHVRDLLRSELSVDVEHNFQPKYRVPNEKRQVVKELKSLAKTAEEIYLATDPDREGEAIAWHLMEAAEIDPKISKRVVFHEITQPAIEEAFAHPRDIDMSLVDAQQARRVLDRLVGYSLSPLLWEKVRSRLSAGRVQSVALRLIVEREREIDAFDPVEYWTLGAELKPHGGKKNAYLARLARLDDAEPRLPDQASVDALLADLEDATYEISKIKRTERRRKPQAPFITSTLQQESSRRLGYTARRTMSLAQQLYEGLDVGEGGTSGLITYMRTDSTNVSELAQREAREMIGQQYGADFLPPAPPQYKTRAVGAQEAHEAIRPTSVLRAPDKVKPFLTPEQFKLYQLIWQRFVASQMEAAIFDTVSVEISTRTQAHEYLWRASGSTLRFPGYLIVYEEAKDEDLKGEDEDNVRIPPGLEEGQRQELVRLIPEQHFTQPPPRFTEATLVQSLEEHGIGRPSTYAPILSTIQERGYVIRETKRLFPTETGILVNDLLVKHFPEIVDLNFTANMESNLDSVAEGEREWPGIVADFYSEFEPQLKKAQEEMPVTKAELEKVGRACPECGHDLVIRWGRFGKFISCSNFPTCRHTEPWLEKIGVTCPKDGGDIVLRKTRKGRIFYGCANYPTCDFTSWKRPVSAPCPKCGGLLVLSNKREVQCTQCQETFPLDQIEETPVETA